MLPQLLLLLRLLSQRPSEVEVEVVVLVLVLVVVVVVFSLSLVPSPGLWSSRTLNLSSPCCIVLCLWSLLFHARSRAPRVGGALRGGDRQVVRLWSPSCRYLFVRNGCCLPACLPASQAGSRRQSRGFAVPNCRSVDIWARGLHFLFPFSRRPLIGKGIEISVSSGCRTDALQTILRCRHRHRHRQVKSSQVKSTTLTPPPVAPSSLLSLPPRR
jgi:hypothetical protein